MDWIEIRCPKCNGEGATWKNQYMVTGVMPHDPGQVIQVKCETCRGVGALLARPLETKPLDKSTGDK